MLSQRYQFATRVGQRITCLSDLAGLTLWLGAGCCLPSSIVGFLIHITGSLLRPLFFRRNPKQVVAGCECSCTQTYNLKFLRSFAHQDARLRAGSNNLR